MHAQTTTFEEKGEPKRIRRTEVPVLTSLTPHRLAKPAHSGPVFLLLNVHGGEKAY